MASTIYSGIQPAVHVLDAIPRSSLMWKLKEKFMALSIIMKIQLVIFQFAVIGFIAFLGTNEHNSGRMASNQSKAGYWGDVTSNVDWCEDNYVKSPYIAEFWNTMSSIGMTTISTCGLVMSIRHRLERRFIVTYFFFLLVGIGSIFFHASLLRSTQLLDEVPMAFVILSLIYLGEATHREHTHAGESVKYPKHSLSGLGRHKGMVWFLIALGVISVSAELAFPGHAWIFQLIFGGMVIFLTVRALQLYNRYSHVDTACRLAELSMALFLTGTIIWLSEPVVCGTWGFLNLHAIWHFFAAGGCYFYIIFSQFLRFALLGKKPKLSIEGKYLLLPIVYPLVENAGAPADSHGKDQ